MPWDELDQRIYDILSRETVEDIPAKSYVVARIRRARTLLEGLLSKGEVLDDNLIRCAIRETAKKENARGGYNPADHGGRSYGQHARSVQRARENAREDWTPRWMQNY